MSDVTSKTAGAFTATASAPVAVPNFRTMAIIIASAMFMEQLDATVLATALPTMARDFNISPPAVSIALTSYLLSLAIFIPVSGKIADRFGARTVFRTAIVIFVIGSILCGQAPNLTFMVAARLLQGFGGALMMPVGKLILMRNVGRHQLVSAMSWMLVPGLIGPILGPPVGGLIVSYLNWRWIFYINVPIGILGFVLVSLFIPNTSPRTIEPFDWIGFVLSGISLGLLLFGFELSSHEGLALLAVSMVAFGLAAGVAYLMHARKHAAPILDFRLMRVPSFGTSVIAGSLTRITQGAQPFLLPLMLQLGFGFSAAQSGLVVASTAIGALGMKAFAPLILRKFGFRHSLIVIGLISTIGYSLCAAFRPDWPIGLIFGILVCCGFFMSFQFTAYNTVAYDEIDAADMSSANSFYTTFQQLMLSFGICIGALALHGAILVRGHSAPQLGDFSVAFLVVTGISLTATIWNARFSKTAGDEMRGRRREKAALPKAA